MIKKLVCILLMLSLHTACQSAFRSSEKNQLSAQLEKAGQSNNAIEIAPLEPINPKPEDSEFEIAPLEPINPKPEDSEFEIAPLEPINPKPEDGEFEIAPLEPVTVEPDSTGLPPEIAPLTPVTDESATTKPTTTPKPKKPGMNADWVLSVDDNAKLIINGITYQVNLYVSMNKSGGKDSTGTYTGKILYTSTVSESEMKKLMEDDTDLIVDSGFMNFTMEAVSASLDVVKFNKKEYAALSGTASSSADYMAVDVIDMRMRRQSNIKAHDSGGGEGEGRTPDMDIVKPIQVRFLINGGQVKAYIGNNPGGEAFSGMVTGTPR